MSSTLIVGDPHLGKGIQIGKSGIGSALNSRVVDQTKLLDWVVQTAIENNIDSIILTGDIFEDSKPDISLIKIFLHFLKKCEINGIEVHIIAGNHDIKRTGSNYTSVLDIIAAAELPLVFIYKDLHTICRNDVGFTFIPFRDRASLFCDSHAEAVDKISKQLAYELEEIPNTFDKVVIGHLSIDGAIFVGDEVDNLANEIMCPCDIFKGYDYVWMGHVHKPQVRKKSNPYVAHIGSMDISDFGETDHKKIVIIYDTDDPKKFRKINIPSRPLRRVRLEIPKDKDVTKYTIDKIVELEKNKTFKDAIVKIEIKLLDPDADNLDRKTIEDKIFSLGAYHISNFSESRSITVIASTSQDIDNTVQPKEAIKLYANQLGFEEEVDKSLYISYAIECYNDFIASINK